MISLFIGFAFLLLGKGNSYDSNELGTYVINCPPRKTTANLRREPSLNPNVKALGGISCGREVQVTGGVQKGDNEEWLPVTYGEQSGYVAKSLLKKFSK